MVRTTEECCRKQMEVMFDALGICLLPHIQFAAWEPCYVWAACSV